MDTNDMDEIENIASEIATFYPKNTEPNIFVTLSDDAVQDFILRQENRITAKKIFYDIKNCEVIFADKG